MTRSLPKNIERRYNRRYILRILTTNNFKYKKIAATDPYRQAAKIVQNLNGVLQKYWKDINKYGKNPVYIQNLTQTLLANLNKTNVAFTSLGIPMGQQVSPIIGNLATQLQTNLQQIGTGMPGSLQPDGSVVQPIDLNNFGTILQEFNQNLSGAMYTGTAQYSEEQRQQRNQRVNDATERGINQGNLRVTDEQYTQGQPGGQPGAQTYMPGDPLGLLPGGQQGQAPQQPQGQQGQPPQQPGQRRMPTPAEVDWDKIYTRGHVTKGNTAKFLNSHGGFGAQMLQRLGVPASWYGLPEDQLSRETKWPSTSDGGWTDQQGKNYSKEVQRQQFNTGIKGIYDDFVGQFGLEEGHKKAVELLGPSGKKNKGSLGVSFLGSYYAEGQAAAGQGDDIFDFGGELGQFAPGRYKSPLKTKRVSKEYQEKGTGTGALLDSGAALEDWEKAIKGEGSMY